MEQHNLNVFESNGLDERSRAYLLETTRWTKFLSILGFIGIGMMILGLFAMMLMGSALTAFGGGMAAFGMIGFTIFFVIIIGLYCYPIYALWKFTTHMKTGLNTNNQEQITEGFRYQKNMYRYMGILAIIFMSFYLLGIIFGGLGSMMGA